MANTSKALGSEIRDFFENNWPEGYFLDDNEIDMYTDDSAGCWILDPNAKYDLTKFGYLIPEKDFENKNVITFKTAFNRWIEQRDYEILTIRIPKAQKTEVLTAIEALGYKVL